MALIDWSREYYRAKAISSANAASSALMELEDCQGGYAGVEHVFRSRCECREIDGHRWRRLTGELPVRGGGEDFKELVRGPKGL